MNKIIISVIAIVGLVACNNASSNQDLSTQIVNLQKWVDSVKMANLTYDSITLVSLEAQYNSASAPLESNTELKEEDKAKVETSKKTWEEFKNDYNSKMNAAKMLATLEITGFNDEAKVKMAKNIFGEVAMMNSMDFSWVNASNILTVYNGFYEKFKANQNLYNNDELAYVKALYEALDTRKNEVEKEKSFKGSDNIKIAQTKTKFSVLFGSTKTGEKSESKN